MADDIQIHDSALTVSYGFPSGPLPLSLRPYEPDEIEENPDLRGQVQPEDEDYCTDVLQDMLLGIDLFWLPKCCQLKGVRETDFSPYSFFDSERRGTTPRTLDGSVMFEVSSAEFEKAYSKGPQGITQAKYALRAIIEKYQSLCSVPGQLSWATSLKERDSKLRTAKANIWDREALDAECAMIRARYPDLPGPDFVGNLCLPHALYRLDMLSTGKTKKHRYGPNWNYPTTFVGLVNQHDPLYLNNGGLSRIYFRVNDDDEVVLVLGDESTEQTKDVWARNSAVTQLRDEIEQAATAAYKEMEDAEEPKTKA